MSLTLSAQTFTILHNFSSQDYGPYDPSGGVVLGLQGELYGATNAGGRWNQGTVYELLPAASAGGAWTEVVLHSFNGPGGGALGLVVGPNGSLYGIHGINETFQLDPPTGTSGDWRYTVIYQFAGVGGVGGGLAFGSPLGYGQSLYGTSGCPGASMSGDAGCETVYRLTPPPAAGGAWTYTPLYTFPGGSQGTFVAGSLAVGAAGTLLGVTENGGHAGGFCAYLTGCGTVFSLTPPAAAGGPWTEAILHAFNPGVGDGNRPDAGLVIGPGGVLYGNTLAGGEGFGSCGGVNGGGGGTVFSLTPPAAAGAPMTETILHEFGVSEGDGCQLATPLVLGPNGVLYGTTSGGGAGNQGTVFELTPPASAGGSWTETILHSFTIGANGNYASGLTLAPDGTLYGTTGGGTSGVGTVFALTP